MKNQKLLSKEHPKRVAFLLLLQVLFLICIASKSVVYAENVMADINYFYENVSITENTTNSGIINLEYTSNTIVADEMYVVMLVEGDAQNYTISDETILYINQTNAFKTEDRAAVYVETYPSEKKNCVVLLSGIIDGVPQQIVLAEIIFDSMEVTPTVTPKPTAAPTVTVTPTPTVTPAPTAAPTPTATPTLTPEQNQRVQVENFVDRLYSILLDRTVDEEGLTYWSDVLVDKQDTGAKVASNIILGEEFTSKTLTDLEFLNRLYQTVFDREMDDTGKEYWLGVLEAGEPRQKVSVNLLNSEEFGGICAQYGITQGQAVLPGDGSGTEMGGGNTGTTQTEQVQNFVKRLYSILLGRDVDEGGLNHWSNVLITKQDTGANVAAGIVFSAEFEGRNLSDEAYIDAMYRTVFDRTPDENGKAYWLSVLAGGEPRKNVSRSLLNSPEFGDICAQYNIIHGTVNAK